MTPERRQLILHPSVAALWALLFRPHAGEAWRLLNDLQVGRWRALAVEGFDDEVRTIVEDSSNRADLAPRLGMDPVAFIQLFIEPLAVVDYLQIAARSPLGAAERIIADRYEVSRYDGATIVLAMTRSAPLVVADERLRSVLEQIEGRMTTIAAGYPEPKPRFEVWWIGDYPWSGSTMHGPLHARRRFSRSWLRRAAASGSGGWPARLLST